MESCPIGPELGIAPVTIMVLAGIAGLMGLTVTIITVIAFCKIFAKAGYCWALGLLILVPLGNLIMVLVLAFSDWPILKEMRALKQSSSGG